MSVQISIEWIKANAAFVSSRIVKLERENAALRAEVDEQARLNGKGSEREAALLAKVETLERDSAALRAAAVEVCALARVWVTVWGDRFSDESLLRFAELELQVLRRAQP